MPRTAASRNLLYNLVRRDLTVRYKSSVLGFFWSFLKPLLLTGIFYVVFEKIVRLPLHDASGQVIPGDQVPYTLHLLTGILAWTFFAGATGESMHAVIANANLIKKIKLPLAVFPLAAVCSHFVHFLLAMLVLFGLLVFSNLGLTPALLLLPAILALHFALTLAFALALSALNVFYRDVASIWEVVTSAWFYGTPIVYSVHMALARLGETGHGWAQWIYLANPMTPVVLAYRRLLIYAAASPPVLEISDRLLLASLGVAFGLTIILIWIGFRLFHHYAHSFADEL